MIEGKMHKLNMVLLSMLVIGFLALVLLPSKVFATYQCPTCEVCEECPDCPGCETCGECPTCETCEEFEECEVTVIYGGGDECEESYKIQKKVRIEGDNSWKDKVTDVEEGDVVEFRIRVYNRGDREVDDAKMTDYLPDEMYRVGGDGLTEYFDDFETCDDDDCDDERVTFKIEAKVKEDEYDRESFEKCVVNKATLKVDGNHKVSDTATVCYGEEEITELPDTGASATTALTTLGFGLMAAGVLIKRSATITL